MKKIFATIAAMLMLASAANAQSGLGGLLGGIFGGNKNTEGSVANTAGNILESVLGTVISQNVNVSLPGTWTYAGVASAIETENTLTTLAAGAYKEKLESKMDGYLKKVGIVPDVTNGIEIRATVSPADHLEILGGEGVGTITLPGFDYPPGSPAINKAPREMIRQNLQALGNASFQVTISVPDGAEIARRTFNPRLGIEGGISIIGVSGIVKPFSEEAFIDSIRKCVTIALASGTDRIVINSGGKSERFVKALYPDLPQQAFVEYGNYIGETLKIIARQSTIDVTLGVMLGKAVKLAAGHLDTHSRRATMDKTFVAQLLAESGITLDISSITLAKELWQLIPSPQLPVFAKTIIRHCQTHCAPLLPNARLTILLIDDDGNIYA